MSFTKNVIAILFVFLLGYILGYVRLETLVIRILEESKELNLLELIGFTASIMTLILFGTYLIGRYLLIKRMEITFLETIEVARKSEIDRFKVIEEYDLGDDTSESIYLMSTEPIRYIRFYEYDFHKFNKGKLIKQHDLLKNGQAIQINTYLTCGIPNYIIEYQRYDYIKGKFEVGENGKNGLVIENLIMKHTVKSIFYYLVK